MTQPRHFGICTAGIEIDFERSVIDGVERCNNEAFTYLEIGLAYGETFRAVHAILTEVSKPFVMLGIEPENFGAIDLLSQMPYVTIFKSTREAAMLQWQLPLDFAFIDGCHSCTCAKGDFISVEPWIKRQGIVVFHDIQPEAYGQIQPHCQAPCNVRGALVELGLLDRQRPGWNRLQDWKGDRTRQGADCGVFQRL